MPWEHEAHQIHISTGNPHHKDYIHVKRDGKTVDISELEREYRLQALEDESKPGWKRLLGL